MHVRVSSASFWQSLFSFGVISLSWSWERPTTSKESKWLYQFLLGGQILLWSILFRGSMNAVGGNDYFRKPKLDVILFSMFYKSLKVLQKKIEGKGKWAKKHPHSRSSYCITGEKIAKWTDDVWTSILPRQLQVRNHCLCSLALKTRLMQKAQEEKGRPPHRSEWYQCKEQIKRTEPEQVSRLPSYKKQCWNPGESFIKGWLKCKGSDLTKEQLIFVALEQDLSPKIWAREWMLFPCSAEWAQSGHRWGISQVKTKPLDNILEWLHWAGWMLLSEKEERRRKHCNYTASQFYLLIPCLCGHQYWASTLLFRGLCSSSHLREMSHIH